MRDVKCYACAQQMGDVKCYLDPLRSPSSAHTNKGINRQKSLLYTRTHCMYSIEYNSSPQLCTTKKKTLLKYRNSFFYRPWIRRLQKGSLSPFHWSDLTAFHQSAQAPYRLCSSHYAPLLVGSLISFRMHADTFLHSERFKPMCCALIHRHVSFKPF